MVDMKKVIEGLECHAEVNCVECLYRDGWRTCPFGETLLADALILLKEQEYKDRMFHALEDDWKAMLKERDEEHRRLLSWLGKFCRHIDNGDAWLTDEENIAFFKKKMKQQFGWDTD